MNNKLFAFIESVPLDGAVLHKIHLVFRSNDGRTGFDSSDDARNVAAEFLREAEIVSPIGAIYCFRDEVQKLRNPLDFLRLAGGARICLHSPNDSEKSLATTLRDHYKSSKLASLKARSGASERKLFEPELKSVLAGEKNADEASIEKLLGACEMVSHWPIDAIGFGVYCVAFAKDVEYGVDQIASACRKADVEFSRVIKKTDLPCW